MSLVGQLAASCAAAGLAVAGIGIGVRRAGWRECGVGLLAAAVVLAELGRAAGAGRTPGGIVGGASHRWLLVVVPLLVGGAELARLVGDLRVRGSRRSVEPAVLRAAVGSTVMAMALALAATAVVLRTGAAFRRTAAEVATATGTSGDGARAVLVPVALAVLALAVIAAAAALRRLSERRQAVRRPARALVAAVVSLLVGGAVLAGASSVHLQPTRAATSADDPAGAVARSSTADGRKEDPEAATPPDAVRGFGELGSWSLLLAGAAAVVLMIVFGRREQMLPPEDLVPDRLVRAPLGDGGVAPTRVETLDRVATLATVDEALVSLRADADPRVAVRLAYATVTHGLGRAELTRRAAETEGEYLQRALGLLEVSGGALGTLTALFARARFSDDAIDERMRATALDALEQIRHDVASRR